VWLLLGVKIRTGALAPTLFQCQHAAGGESYLGCLIRRGGRGASRASSLGGRRRIELFLHTNWKERDIEK